MSGIGEPVQHDETTRERLRILCVADEFPWPERTGYRIRLANMLRGLAEVGAVDLMILHPGAPNDLGVSEIAEEYRAPLNEPVERTVVVNVPTPVASLRGAIPWLSSGLPRRVAWRDWSAARVAVSRELVQSYDLIWWSHLDTWSAIGDLANAPSIVDLDNLEDQKMLTSLMTREPPPARRVPALIRFVLVRELDRVDIRRWRRAQSNASRNADAVVVCSPQDRDALGGEQTYVIENGYVSPNEPVGHPESAVPAIGGTLVFIGLQTYEPNIDASSFLVKRVLPILLESRPEISIRIIGRAGVEVRELAGPNVEIIGEVDSIEGELIRADVSVVPLRIGAGTRIKILEALAHHVPIVTTTLGCEGLSLVGGVHCEIADTAQDFADSCDSLLADIEKRIQLAEAGAALQAKYFDWVNIRSRVGDLAQTVCRKGS